MAKNDGDLFSESKPSSGMSRQPEVNRLWAGPLPAIKLVHYPQGTQLSGPEQAGDQIYCLISGKVSVQSPGKRTRYLKQTGDLFGEAALTGQGYTQTTKAASPVDALVVRVADLQSYRDLDLKQARILLKDLFTRYMKIRLESADATPAGKAPHQAHYPAAPDPAADGDTELENLRQQLKKTRQDYELANAQFVRITAEFKRFVQKPLLDRMSTGQDIGDYDSLHPGHHTEEEELTIMFSDIRSFSTLSEMMTSEETFDFLNSYMMRMEPCITGNKGYIDKLIGDAIMAIFKNADDAVAAAIAMEEAVNEYNRKRLADGRDPISTGIGINTGTVMIGLLGTMVHLESTVIGDAVNLASRLESLTKLYGVRILVSEFSFNHLTNQEYIRLIDRVRVKGRETPAGVYEVFGFGRADIIGQKRASQPVFEQAYEDYLAGRFAEALTAFRECCEICDRDIVSRVYMGRCEYLIEHIPEAGWDGIFQHRASRFILGDQAGNLYFEHSLHNASHVPVLIHNISLTGILIFIEPDYELFVGERILIEFTPEVSGNPQPLAMTCQVMRGRSGRLADGKACLEYGLEFYEMSLPQKQALGKILLLLQEENPDSSAQTCT